MAKVQLMPKLDIAGVALPNDGWMDIKQAFK